MERIGGEGKLRRYGLHVDELDTWLPRTLIEGAGDERPMMLLRQTRDTALLRLLLDLYAVHDLREDGGLPQTLLHRPYDRTRIGDARQYVVWGYDHGHDTARTDHAVMQAHYDPESFWSRWRTLTDLRLVECVPTLLDGPDGEPLVALDDEETRDAAHQAAEGLLSDDYQYALDYSLVVPVERHIAHAHMVGVFRLTHRPHTEATTAWWGEHIEAKRDFLRKMRATTNQGVMAAVG